MADPISPPRCSPRGSSDGTSSSVTVKRPNCLTPRKDSPPVELPTMGDPISTPERSIRRSITAASSPAISERRESNVLMESNGLPVGSSVNKNYFLTKLQTPSVHQNVTASLHGSRPSISSVSSASTTGSSIQSDRFFDIRESTPLSDSNPTSPEEDTSPIAACRAKISSLRIDSNCEALAADESPLVDRERRRKPSTKSQPGPNPLTLSSNPLVELQSTLNETQRPNLAWDDTSPTELNSPSILLARSLHRLSLNEVSDTITLPRTRSASLQPPQTLTADQRARASSASCSIRKGVKDRAEVSSVGIRQDEPSETSLNSSPASEVLPQTVNSNNGSNSRSKKQTRRSSSQASTEELTEATSTLKDSPAPTISSPSTAHRNLTTAGRSLRSRGAKFTVLIEPVNRRKSSNVQKKPPRRTRGEDSASEIEDEVVIIDPNDTNAALPLKSKRRSLPDSTARSIGHSDASDRGVLEIRVAEEAIREPSASSTPNRQDGAQSEPNFMTEDMVEPATNGERIRLTFQPYSSITLSEEALQIQLIRMLKDGPQPESESKSKGKSKTREAKGPKQPPSKTKLGSVYVYSLPSCQQESGTQSTPVYQYFKVGFTLERDPVKRMKEQQPCYQEKIIPIRDKNQREFSYPEFVESLVHCEFQGHQMTLPCRGPHMEKGVTRQHREWFKVEEKRLLDSIEKWRSWITENDPYHFRERYYLKYRWQWRLDRLSRKSRNKTLNDMLKPFTVWEDLEYRRDWIYRELNELYTIAQDVISVLSSTVRFLAIFGTAFYLVSTLSLTLGWTCFVLATSLIVYVAPR